MRFKSKRVDGYQIFAVSGTNTVSFGIDFTGANTDGLLGFAIERQEPGKKPLDMYGYKVFPSIIPKPDGKTAVFTSAHPVQSFVWDDFTAKPGLQYKYRFLPLKGTPNKLDRSAAAIPIAIEMEPLFSDRQHDIFFNRGVASSQAYVRKYGNKRPDQLPPKKYEEAKEWLSRSLDEAIVKFIEQATAKDTLLCSFYEFRYEPVLVALKKAIDAGVDVKIIVDAKVNEHFDKKLGKTVESFPREDNLRMIESAGIPDDNIILRESKPNEIQHNKFMILLRPGKKAKSEVWTGSTNLSIGGFHGQTNVGHWIRDNDVAAAFKAYWELLKDDPGPKKGASASEAKKKNAKWRKAVGDLAEIPTTANKIPKGITCIFSPRAGLDVLKMYAAMVDDATDLSCITLAFGIGKIFKELLSNNTPDSHIAFFLLEKQDKPNARSKDPFVALTAKNNVYKAWGSYLRDPVYQWAKETSAKALGLNTHVSYIHSKFLLKDPLSTDPIVVTGSANFSDPSTTDNDENMLVIRGEQRVADIYFTEFNRLFNHYYFRSIMETNKNKSAAEKKKSKARSLFLSEKDDWLKDYKKADSLKRKRVAIFSKMKGFS